MRKILGCFIILIIMMTSHIFAGTVYYLDATNGDDSNNGTSSSTAWKTISKVNSYHFFPGDSIKFKCGEEWREQLNIPSSGSFVQPITFTSYGSGDKPIINGADIITDWSLDSSNIWYAICNIDPKQVFFDGTRGIAETAKSNLNAEYEWYWNSNILYVYSTTDPDTVYKNPGIESQTKHICINLYNKDFIDIRGFDLRYGNFGVNVSICNNINISGNDISYISKRGIYPDQGSSNINIYQNNFSYCGINIPTAEHAIYLSRVNYIEIYENEISHSWDCGIKVDGCDYVKIYKNYIHDNVDSGDYFAEILVTSNSQPMTDIEIYYNIIEASGGYAIQTDKIGTYSISNVDIYNNTFWDNSPGAGPKLYVLRIEDVDGLNIKNNTMLTSRTYVLRYLRNTSVNRDYNCYYGWTHGTYIGNIDGSNVTWANLSSEETYSINQDPLFTDVGNNNFTLQAESPCIDVGINVGITEDYAGNSVPYGYGVDIGAYEYVGENPPFNANADASPTSGETPLTVNFTGNAAGGTAPYSYSWDFGDGGYSTEQNPSHTYYADGNYTAILTVTDNEGNQDSDSVTITVTAPLAPVVASSSASPTSGDSPLTVYFTGNATGGIPPYTYNWNFGDGQSSNQQNPSHTYNNAGNYTATLTVTDSNTSQDSDSLTINVTSPAPPPLVASCIASPTSGDVPFTVYFTGIASGGTPPYSYNWNFGDGENSSQQNPSHTYNVAGNYTVTFTVTDSQSIQDSVSLTITATLSPTPAYLSCSPTNFYFGVSISGTLSSSQNMRLINAGDGTMTWNAAESTPWLSCSPLSGTNRGQVSISVNASGLSPGTYNAIITVSSPQAYNSPQLIKVNLRVYESGLESDPSEDTDDRFDGTPVGGRAAIAERTLPNARFKEVEAKTNSDPNNPIAANSSLGLVSKGSVSMADNSTENRDLGRPELKSNDQELETGGLEIGLEEIWKGHELQSVGDEEMEEDRMTIDQSGKLEPQKHKPRLSTEKNPSDIPNVQIEESEPLRIVFSRSMRENISFIGWGEDELTALPIGSTLDMLKGEFSWIPQPGSIGQYILHFAVTDGSRKSRPLRIVVDVIPKSND